MAIVYQVHFWRTSGNIANILKLLLLGVEFRRIKEKIIFTRFPALSSSTS
jgi:hypothetical protein